MRSRSGSPYTYKNVPWKNNNKNFKYKNKREHRHKKFSPVLSLFFPTPDKISCSFVTVPHSFVPSSHFKFNLQPCLFFIWELVKYYYGSKGQNYF